METKSYFVKYVILAPKLYNYKAYGQFTVSSVHGISIALKILYCTLNLLY